MKKVLVAVFLAIVLQAYGDLEGITPVRASGVRVETNTLDGSFVDFLPNRTNLSLQTVLDYWSTYGISLSTLEAWMNSNGAALFVTRDEFTSYSNYVDGTFTPLDIYNQHIVNLHSGSSPSGGAGTSNVLTYTSSGTYYVATNAIRVEFFVWGGGGTAGGASGGAGGFSHGSFEVTNGAAGVPSMFAKTNQAITLTVGSTRASSIVASNGVSLLIAGAGGSGASASGDFYWSASGDNYYKLGSGGGGGGTNGQAGTKGDFNGSHPYYLPPTVQLCYIDGNGGSAASASAAGGGGGATISADAACGQPLGSGSSGSGASGGAGNTESWSVLGQPYSCSISGGRGGAGYYGGGGGGSALEGYCDGRGQGAAGGGGGGSGYFHSTVSNGYLMAASYTTPGNSSSGYRPSGRAGSGQAGAIVVVEWR